MAVFYVLPPRPALGECLARLLRPYLPGIDIANETCAEMMDALVNDSAQDEEAYIVHREDLPDNSDLTTALSEGFGAEPGDRIVCVSLGAKAEVPKIVASKIAA